MDNKEKYIKYKEKYIKYKEKYIKYKQKYINIKNNQSEKNIQYVKCCYGYYSIDW